jgi:hypothetical protein
MNHHEDTNIFPIAMNEAIADEIRLENLRREIDDLASVIKHIQYEASEMVKEKIMKQREYDEIRERIARRGER